MWTMLTIDHGSDVPLVEQIVRGIRLAIANGTLPSGVELPPVRQLANDLAVNLNTVSRAYQALQASALVHTARGRGTHVTNTKEETSVPSQSLKVRIDEGVQRILADAKLAGFQRNEAEAILAQQLDHFWPRKSVPKRRPTRG